MPSLYHIDKQVAVYGERLAAISASVEKRFNAIDRKLDDVIAGYATKADLAKMGERVATIENGISWAIKIIVGAVITGLLTLLFKSGLFHA